MLTSDEQLKMIKGLVPPLSQRQDSVTDQLITVMNVANHIGCYDAADAIKNLIKWSK